jgi:hypothetical protein
MLFGGLPDGDSVVCTYFQIIAHKVDCVFLQVLSTLFEAMLMGSARRDERNVGEGMLVGHRSLLDL